MGANGLELPGLTPTTPDFSPGGKLRVRFHLTDVDPLLRLVYVVEEEPLPEAASMGAFVVGQFLELFPGQAEGCREGLKDLQDVRQLSGEVIRRGLLCFAGLFGKLGQQRGAVAVLVQGMGHRAASVRFNDRRDPVPDQLAVIDSHSWRIREAPGLLDLMRRRRTGHAARLG